MWNKSACVSAGLDGGVASLGFFALYMFTMRVFTGGWSVGIQRFGELFPYFAAFFVSIFVLVSVSRLAHAAMLSHDSLSRAPLTSSGTTMVLCCLHHVTDIVPFLGLSGVSLFLFKYQAVLLAASAGMNMIVAYMMIRKAIEKAEEKRVSMSQ